MGTKGTLTHVAHIEALHCRPHASRLLSAAFMFPIGFYSFCPPPARPFARRRFQTPVAECGVRTDDALSLSLSLPCGVHRICTECTLLRRRYLLARNATAHEIRFEDHEHASHAFNRIHYIIVEYMCRCADQMFLNAHYGVLTFLTGWLGEPGHMRVQATYDVDKVLRIG